MSYTPSTGPEQDRSADVLTRAALNRRSFLRYTGATAVVGGLLLAGCKDDDDDVPPPQPVQLKTKLTRDDTGILNYAYALEQLEAAFYTKVVAEAANLFTGPGELDLLKQIRDHEVIHREFFKRALGDNRLIDLTVDYTANGDTALAVDFTSRASILKGARLFEDTGVQAYNGAGRYISNTDYLVLAGKIVSVEARHASLLRDLIEPNSFAAKTQMGSVPPALNAQGLDMSAPPSAILPTALKFIRERASLTSELW